MFIAVMRNSKGISLIETLITMVIVSIGLLGTYSLIVNVHATRMNNTRLVETQQEARNIVEHMVRDLRESSVDYVWIYSTGEEANSIVSNNFGDSSIIYFSSISAPLASLIFTEYSPGAKEFIPDLFFPKILMKYGRH